MSYHPETSISAQGPLGPRDDIGRGWYGMWYGFCHVLYTLSYISTEEYYIIWTVFWSIALGYLQFYFCLVSKALKELLNYLSEAPGLPYNLRAVVLKIFCLLLYFFVCFVFFIVAFSVPKNMKTWRSWRHIPNNDVIQKIYLFWGKFFLSKKNPKLTLCKKKLKKK